jgi:hypothetical protein
LSTGDDEDDEDEDDISNNKDNDPRVYHLTFPAG